MTRTGAFLVCCALFVVGCGGYPPPNDKVATTTASVAKADEAGATKNPQAALHLKLAQEQLEQAKALMKDGDNKRAEYVLLRADTDAQLAEALAKEAGMRAEADKAREELRALKKGN